MSYGCPALVSGSPVGGGNGYTDLASPDRADHVASTPETLRSALAAATSGQIVYVADGAAIVLSSNAQMFNPAAGIGFYVPDGVTLAAGRGRSGIIPGRIEVAKGFRDNDWAYLVQCGRGADVQGLNLYGNQDSTATGYSWTGIRCGIGSQLHNNELHGFGYSGASALPDITGVWVHHNYIHHCRGIGHGYGVEVAAVSGVLAHDQGFHLASALVEGNAFDYCRHVVANQSGRGSYTARYNYLMEHAAYESIFDVHGQNDDPPGSMAMAGGEYVYCAGELVEIYGNTSACAGANEFVGIRGIPYGSNRIKAYNNWLKVPGDPSLIVQFMFRMPGWAYDAIDNGGEMASGSGYGPFVQVDSYDNWYGAAESPDPDPTPDPPADGQTDPPTDPPADQPKKDTPYLWPWLFALAALGLGARLGQKRKGG